MPKVAAAGAVRTAVVPADPIALQQDESFASKGIDRGPPPPGSFLWVYRGRRTAGNLLA